MAELAFKDDGDCRVCGKKIPKGTPIAFAEGVAKDGHTFTAPIHSACDTGFKPAGGVKIPPPSVPVAPSKPRFVNIGAWVRIEDAPKLLAKIAELSLGEDR